MPAFLLYNRGSPSLGLGCGLPPNVQDGSVSFDVTTANYSCSEGYELRGIAVRKCLETGMWSGDDPTCTRKKQ